MRKSLLIFCALAFHSCASTHANHDMCPILGKPIDASVKKRSFAGEEYGFCCNGCLSRWDKMTNAERAEATSN